VFERYNVASGGNGRAAAERLDAATGSFRTIDEISRPLRPQPDAGKSLCDNR
jgi:hypothetical protein